MNRRTIALTLILMLALAVIGTPRWNNENFGLSGGKGAHIEENILFNGSITCDSTVDILINTDNAVLNGENTCPPWPEE